MSQKHSKSHSKKNDLSQSTSIFSQSVSSSSSNINTRSSRKRRHSTLTFTNASRNSDDVYYDDIEDIDDDSREADLYVNDEDYDDENTSSDDEVDNNNNNKTNVNTSISTSKNEVDESALRSSPRSTKKIKTNAKSARPIWDSKISEISVPISSFRRCNITHRLKKYSPLQLLQLFVTKEFVNRWVIYTNNHCLHKFEDI
jgi:hypothetical protein